MGINDMTMDGIGELGWLEVWSVDYEKKGVIICYINSIYCFTKLCYNRYI